RIHLHHYLAVQAAEGGPRVKNRNPRPVTLLLAEDDPDDCLLARQALEKSQLISDLRCVEDGEELLDYLRRRGKFADPKQSPRPGLILLDLNMPRKDGREALREIKNDPKLDRKSTRLNSSHG